MTKRGKPARGDEAARRAQGRLPAESPTTSRPTHHAGTTRRDGSRSNRQSSGLLFMLVPALLVVVLGGGLWYFVGSQGDSVPRSSEAPAQVGSQSASLLTDVVWPGYVARGPQSVKEAYQYAVMRPDVLDYMPCYCGCGEHNGHRSNKECFIANYNQGGSTVAFEQHGST